jgi:NAD(P)-dependent dehydrogenase (short-subunit alcohol dehydrogenase family)
MSGRLTGKVVLVTGAGSAGAGLGNGQAVARRLAEHGACVVCADLEVERAAEVAASIESAGGTAVAFGGDVTDPATCAAAVALAVSSYGGLHGLVNNVGGGGAGGLDSIDLAGWQRVIDLNLTSAMLCAQAAAPAMRAAGGGSIVSIGSTVAQNYSGPGAMAYAAAKAGLTGLTVNLAGQLGPDQIRANVLVVGFIWSSMIESVAGQMPPDWREQRRRAGLLPDEGSPWDVADAATFLISDESRWITGQSLILDAGATAK